MAKIQNGLVTLILVLACIFLSSCGRDSVAAPALLDAATELPLLVSLPRTAAESGALFQDGADYLDSLPSQNVTRDGLLASYAPAGSEFDEMAFAIYHFDLSGMLGNQSMLFNWDGEWQFSGDPPNFWLALPNWTEGRWDWFAASDAELFQIADIAPYIRAEDGASYCVLLFSGTENPRLASLEFASAPSIESVAPLIAVEGSELTISAVVEGSGELSYAWNFGGGAEPDSSPEASPLITAGTIGSYNCSLLVTSDYGVDNFEFVFRVGEAHGEGWVHALFPSGAAKDCVVDSSGNLIIHSGGLMQSSFSPDGALNWSSSYYMPNPDTGFSGRGIALDSAGDIYIAGTLGDDLIGMAEGLFLAKFSAGDGTPLWLKRWTTEGFRDGGALAIDSLDRIHVTGSSRDFGMGLDDCALISFDSDGELLEEQLWGNAEPNYGEHVAVDSLDNIYVSGYSHDVIGDNGFESFLLKFDSEGSLQRQQGFDGTNNTTMALRDDGSLVFSFSSGFDSCLLELESDGDLKWARSYLYAANTHFNDLLLAADGSIYLSGSFKTDNLQDRLDCVITHASATGDLISARWWDYNGEHESFEAIAAAPDGAVFLCGYAYSHQGIWEDISGQASVAPVTPGPTALSGVITETALLTTDSSLTLSLPTVELDVDSEYSKTLLMRYTP